MPAENRVEDLSDDLAVPRRNGELVFAAPWEGRVFGISLAVGAVLAAVCVAWSSWLFATGHRLKP